jgi:putative hydrolase of the HAD superfamily
MVNKNVIVFDLDDTLFYEIEYLVSAYRYIAMILEKKYSVSNVFSFMLQTYYNKKNVFEEVNKNYSLNISIDTYLSLYRNHVPIISLNAETKEVLSILKQSNNIILGLLTDGREVTQKNKIASLGLDKYIHEKDIIISESFGSAKPSLSNYLYFQQKYYYCNKFIYVGDNVSKDFIAPNQLNWITICLLDNGKNVHIQNFSLPSGYLPQYTISNMIELLRFV